MQSPTPRPPLPQFPRSRREKWIIAYLAILTVCVGIQCAVTALLLWSVALGAPPRASLFQPTRSPQKTVRIGERYISPDGYALTIKQVNTAQSPENFPAQDGYEFLTTEIVAENIVAHTWLFQPSNFYLQDEQGKTYSQGPAIALPEIGFVSLSKGETASGWLTFQVPKDAQGLVLYYRPAHIAFDLER